MASSALPRCHCRRNLLLSNFIGCPWSGLGEPACALVLSNMQDGYMHSRVILQGPASPFEPYDADT